MRLGIPVMAIIEAQKIEQRTPSGVWHGAFGRPAGN